MRPTGRAIFLSNFTKFIKKIAKFIHPWQLEFSESNPVFDLLNNVQVLIGTAEYCVKLGKEFFNEFNMENKIGMICYEEVHCDFLFGKCFREDLLNVKSIFEDLKSAVRVSITASPVGGNPDFMAKISGLSDNYFLSKRNLQRDNLEIVVKTASLSRMESLTKLLHGKEKTIIFCHKIDSCHQLKLLLAKDLPDRNYHLFSSKLTSQDKQEVYSNFASSKNDILITTKSQAFGVNYSDIGLVIIWELPDSLKVLPTIWERVFREAT